MSERMYEPIWKKLKEAKVVTIAANAYLHKRIIKAVQKEKYYDFGFKIENQPFNAILTYARKNEQLTFKITNFLSSNITAEDL